MLRIDSPWGRLYKVQPTLILPSVTTVLKATEKRGFNRSTWERKLITKGLSDYEASIFTAYFIGRGMVPALAYREVEEFIETPMNKKWAGIYMDWKSAHSSDRGNRLHNFLETTLPVGEILHWDKKPEVAEHPDIQPFVDSLWDGGVLQNIKRVHSVEERLWWYSDGIGYAGTEDICYETWDDLDVSGDWKSKDPKPYEQSKYDHEYRIQLIAYAGARFARKKMKMDGLHINFCFSDGSPAQQTVVTGDDCQALWSEWIVRLKAWWGTVGTQALSQRYA